MEEVQLLGRFWSVNQYNLLLNSLKEIEYERNKNLFIFDYDWRLSNYDSAKLLDAFVRRHIGAGRGFDILAHSMGGIVARIYIDGYPSAKSLSRIVYLGTPFLGSMNTFGTIKEGWGFVQNRLAGGQDVIWRASLSFPAMLELLPRYRECCYIRTQNGQRATLDVFDVETWRKHGWLPAAYSDPKRLSAFTKNLQRAKTLTDLLSKPAPASVWEIFFAGDVHSTLRRLGMTHQATTPADWFFSRERGDGTVPVWSAARRPDQGGYDNSLPSYAQHQTIFDDKWLVNKLARTLLKARPSDPDPIDARGRPVLAVTVDGLAVGWSIEVADILLSEYVADANSTIQAELNIKLEDSVGNLRKGRFLPKASYRHSGSAFSLSVVETTEDNDIESKTLRFVATLSGLRSGVGEIVFEIDGNFAPHAAFFVADATR